MKCPVKQQGNGALCGFSVAYFLCLICCLTVQTWCGVLHNFERTFVCVICISVSSTVCMEGKRTVTLQDEKDGFRVYLKKTPAEFMLDWPLP